MPIFLDTSRIAEIARFHKMGIVRGVTTNPTILLKEGVKGGMAGVEAACRAIAELVHPLPVSVEVTSNDAEEMLRQAKLFAAWAPNINVKITIHGPNGELDNLATVHRLETQENIRVNVTAMMSSQQCLLAALAGATYVSIFCGRVNNMGYDSRTEIERTRRLLDRFSLGSQIIAASTREVVNVVEWLDAGAHIVTVLPALLEGMLVHPYTKETVQMFLRDGASITALMRDVSQDQLP